MIVNLQRWTIDNVHVLDTLCQLLPVDKRELEIKMLRIHSRNHICYIFYLCPYKLLVFYVCVGTKEKELMLCFRSVKMSNLQIIQTVTHKIFKLFLEISDCISFRIYLPNRVSLTTNVIYISFKFV